jgi:septal ring factor EnvC (AmiA/AmiB activator)
MPNQDYIDFMNAEKAAKQQQISNNEQTIAANQQQIVQANTNIDYYNAAITNTQDANTALNADIAKIDEIVTILEQ